MSNVNNIAPINEDTNIVKYEIDDIKQKNTRFLDRKYIYHIGASIKDLGKKCFGITLIKYDAIIEDILSKLENNTEGEK